MFLLDIEVKVSWVWGIWILSRSQLLKLAPSIISDLFFHGIEHRVLGLHSWFLPFVRCYINFLAPLPGNNSRNGLIVGNEFHGRRKEALRSILTVWLTLLLWKKGVRSHFDLHDSIRVMSSVFLETRWGTFKSVSCKKSASNRRMVCRAGIWKNFLYTLESTMLASLEATNRGMDITGHFWEEKWLGILPPSAFLNLGRGMKQLCGDH